MASRQHLCKYFHAAGSEPDRSFSSILLLAEYGLLFCPSNIQSTASASNARGRPLRIYPPNTVWVLVNTSGAKLLFHMRIIGSNRMQI